MTFKFYVLLSLISITTYAQNPKQECSDTLTIDFEKDKKGMFIGCLNYENKMDGVGTLYFPDKSVYEGQFKNNQIEGEGKLLFSNGSYIGSFVRGRYNGQGVEILNLDSQTQISEGTFLNGVLFDGKKEIDFGDSLKQNYKIDSGELTKVEQYISGELKLTLEGSFYPDSSLKTGKKTESDGNMIVTSLFVNGIEEERMSNIENTYNANDIVGDSEYIEVSVGFEKNRDTKFINLKFAPIDKQYRFVFDTGAEVFSIGYRLFEELKEKGLQYEDLDIEVPTVGIIGKPTINKIIRINELTIGEYTIYNTIAYVETLDTANANLLGIQFLKKFKQVYWSLNDNRLIFYK